MTAVRVHYPFTSRSTFQPFAYGHELWVVTESIRFWIQAAKISCLQSLAGLSVRYRVRSLDIRREHRVELLLSQGFLDMTNWEETSGQTQNLLEGLHMSSLLGTPKDLQGGAGKGLLGRGTSEIPHHVCSNQDLIRDKWKRMDE